MIVDNPQLLEMLQNLDAALKMQAIVSNPNMAYVGPSVAELAATRIESLLQEIKELNEELMELKFNEVEVQKLGMKPGEVLIVKIRSDELTQAAMASLRSGFANLLPNNRVVVLGVDNAGSIDLTIASSEEYPEEVKPKVDCSTINYCDGCSCGKKEAYEKQKGE